METITLPNLPGHTITITLDGTWLSCQVRDENDAVRYSAGWEITPSA